jgi:hypothetical protein
MACMIFLLTFLKAKAVVYGHKGFYFFPRRQGNYQVDILFDLFPTIYHLEFILIIFSVAFASFVI